MQSPFAIFRKYQRECILVFGFLILISFTVGQSVMDIVNRDGQIPPILKFVLAVTLIGGIAWGVGLQRDQAKEYGLWGVLFGAVVGVALTQFGGAAAAVSTTAGDLSAADIQRLVRQRKIVNQFLYDGVDAIMPTFGDDPNGQMAQFRSSFIQQQLQGFQFSYGGSPEQDVVFAFLLRQEAKRMGIRVSDESIGRYINRATSEKLSREKFNEIRKRQNVSQRELYDMLRAELLARAALRQSQPMPQTTPGEYWQMYRKMKVTQQLEAVAIPVADFETDLSQPTKSDIKRFFEEHKERFANQEGTGKPGFRQPRRIQVGFFEPDYEVIEADVIKQLETEFVSKKERQSVLETATGELKKLLEGGGKVNQLDFEIASRYELDKDFLYKIDPLPEDDDTKKDDAKKDDKKKPTTKPKTDEKKPTPKNPDTKKPSPKQDAPKKKDDSDGAAALDGVKGSTSPVAFLQDEPKKDAPKKKDTAKKDDTKKPKPKNQSPKKSEPKEDAPQAKTGDEKKKSPEGKTDDSKAKPDEKKAEKTDDGEKTEPKPNYKPLDDELKDDIRDRVIEDKTQDEINDRIERADRGSGIKDAGQDFLEENGLQGLAFALNTGKGEDNKPISLRQATVDLRKYARQHGLVYVVTPRLSLSELRDSEDYAIGRASVPGGSASPFSQQPGQTLLPDLFDDGRQMFRAGVGEDLGVASLAYIRINDAAQHVPRLEPLEKPGSIPATKLNEELGFEWIKPSEDIVTLQDYIKKELGGIPKKDVKLERGRFRITILESDGRTISKVRLEEPGIVEQVRKAWLLAKARPNAAKRAKELASLAKSGKEQTLAETLEGKTVTGKKGSLELDDPITTGPFSWLRQAQVPQLGMRSQTSPPQLTSLPILGTEGGQVGSDFMETVFNKLKNGEVGVVSNARRTVYFVVKVVQRSPLDPERDEDFRKQFLEEDVVGGGGPSASPYEYLAGARFQELTTRWSQQLNTKYGVDWDPAYQARLAQ